MSKKKTDRAKILEHSFMRLTAVWGATVASPLVRNKVGQVEFCTAQQYYQVEQSSNGTFLEILPDETIFCSVINETTETFLSYGKMEQLCMYYVYDHTTEFRHCNI